MNRSVTEAMESLTATEFWRTVALMEKEATEQRAEHFYAAQIASEIACLPFLVWGKQPPEEFRRLSTFMLKFGTQEEIEAKMKRVEEERAEIDAELATAIMLSMFGMGPDGKVVERDGTKLVTQKPPSRSGSQPVPPAPFGRSAPLPALPRVPAQSPPPAAPTPSGLFLPRIRAK